MLNKKQSVNFRIILTRLYQKLEKYVIKQYKKSSFQSTPKETRLLNTLETIKRLDAYCTIGPQNGTYLLNDTKYNIKITNV